jgi:hypothetical protein
METLSLRLWCNVAARQASGQAGRQTGRRERLPSAASAALHHAVRSTRFFSSSNKLRTGLPLEEEEEEEEEDYPRSIIF